jgi:hypothetical protein
MITTWEDYFRQMKRPASDFQIGADEVLSNLRAVNDDYNYTSDLQVGISIYQMYPEEDFSALSIFPNTSIENWVNDYNVDISLETSVNTNLYGEFTYGADVYGDYTIAGAEGLVFTIIDKDIADANVHYTTLTSLDLTVSDVISFWMKIENYTGISVIGFDLKTDTNNFFYVDIVPVDNDWHFYEYAFTTFLEHGTPSWVNINQIAYYVVNTGVVESVIHVKDMVSGVPTIGVYPDEGLYPGGEGVLETLLD